MAPRRLRRRGPALAADARGGPLPTSRPHGGMCSLSRGCRRGRRRETRRRDSARLRIPAAPKPTRPKRTPGAGGARLLTNAREAARTAESQLAGARALVRADEAARKAADDAEDARAPRRRPRRTRADVPQEVARRLRWRGIARGRTSDGAENGRESARLSGHARGEVAAAAGRDPGLGPKERAEGDNALHELRSSPRRRVLGALRAISAAERVAPDARRPAGRRCRAGRCRGAR